MKSLKLQNFKLLNLALLIFGAFVFLIIPNSVKAYTASEIIPDYVFRSKNTMTEAQIQDFLVSKKSFLANYKIPASYTATYWIGDKQVSSYINEYIGPIGQEVSAKNWPVSKVIYQAAQWYNVNPQVLLAILQKESSLVADSNTINWLDPAKFARVAWAMGYAYTESGISNTCATSTNKNPTGSCAGVAMQIDWAAGTLDYWYKQSEASRLTCAGGQNCWKGQTPIIDGKATYIGNHITGPFYRYTPHLTWGGTFTWCMNNWFPFDFRYVFDVTQSLSLSNTNPFEGENVSASYTVKNITDTPFTIKLTISDYATDAKAWNSFPYQEITINPRETYQYTASRVAKYAGKHNAYIAFLYNNNGYAPISSSGQITQVNYNAKPINQAFTITAGLYLNNTNPFVGEIVNGAYIVKNNAKSSLTIDLALVDYAIDAKLWNSFPLMNSVTISPGGTARFDGTHTIKGAGLHRTWLAFIHNGVPYDFLPTPGQLNDFWYRAK